MGVKFKADDLPMRYRDQIRKQLDPPTQVDKIPTPVEMTKADKISEKELQITCENLLRLRGYLRLTADNVEIFDTDSHAGFFGHLHNPKRNPLMPDLWIMARQKLTLYVELKVVSIYQRGQKEMIDAGFWHEIRTFDAFVKLLNEWEGEK